MCFWMLLIIGLTFAPVKQSQFGHMATTQQPHASSVLAWNCCLSSLSTCTPPSGAFPELGVPPKSSKSLDHFYISIFSIENQWVTSGSPMTLETLIFLQRFPVVHRGIRSWTTSQRSSTGRGCPSLLALRTSESQRIRPELKQIPPYSCHI